MEYFHCHLSNCFSLVIIWEIEGSLEAFTKLFSQGASVASMHADWLGYETGIRDRPVSDLSGCYTTKAALLLPAQM